MALYSIFNCRAHCDGHINPCDYHLMDISDFFCGNFISRDLKDPPSSVYLRRGRRHLVLESVIIIRTMSSPSAFRAKTNAMKTWRPKNPPSVRRSKCVCIASNIHLKTMHARHDDSFVTPRASHDALHCKSKPYRVSRLLALQYFFAADILSNAALVSIAY
jgi:hypothetical protein